MVLALALSDWNQNIYFFICCFSFFFFFFSSLTRLSISFRPLSMSLVLTWDSHISHLPPFLFLFVHFFIYSISGARAELHYAYLDKKKPRAVRFVTASNEYQVAQRGEKSSIRAAFSI